ncbi:MAG: hypothetical protein AB8B56_03220 [Crocinitomicaceae bacterium]
MKTSQRKEQDEATKCLFQQLFVIQYEFEQRTDRFDLKGLKIIRLMDELLDTILDEYND